MRTMTSAFFGGMTCFVYPVIIMVLKQSYTTNYIRFTCKHGYMETRKEEQISVLIPSELKLRLDTFVFKARVKESPNRKTTLKGTVIEALDQFLPPLEG